MQSNSLNRTAYLYSTQYYITCICVCMYVCIIQQCMYRVIHKSLQDFRPLRYSSRNGHAGRGACQQRKRHSKFLSYLTGARYVHHWSILTEVSRTRSTVSADDPGRPFRFAAHRLPLCWSFVYHSRTDLSVGGSVWYMVRNLRCTATIDSVLANSKTHSSFLSPVHAIFRHDCPLAVKPASTPRRLLPKQTWTDSQPTDMLLSAVSVLVLGQPGLEFREGRTNYPVYIIYPLH